MKTKEEILKDCKIESERLQQEKPMLYHCILKAMEQYAEQQVENCAIPLVSDSLDLQELERKLDEALGKETRETLTEWLKQQRQ